MNRLTERIFKISPHGVFTSQDVKVLFPGSPDSRYGLVRRALANGEIIQIRRGLYCLAQRYRRKPLNLFSLAQYIYGPSYISLESALSSHGWIPEAVYTVSSVSMGNSKLFNTPVGVFSYSRVPQDLFYAGVDRQEEGNGEVIFMATPLKALADYVYVHGKDWSHLAPAMESLRIEQDTMTTVSVDMVDELFDTYRNRRVRRFLEGIREELNR